MINLNPYGKRGEPWFEKESGHWFVQVGDVMIETLTKEKAIEAKKTKASTYKKQVLANDIARIGW